jgi:hypothetical protein
VAVRARALQRKPEAARHDAKPRAARQSGRFPQSGCRKLRMRPGSAVNSLPTDEEQANRRPVVSSVGSTLLGAVFNLNHPAHMVHSGFFEMSVANVVVIALMLIVFALAVLLPFPGAARRRRGPS